PDGPGYLPWLAVKLLHYLTSAIWHSPMTVGPSGRYNPISEVPGDCLLMLGIVAIMSVGYFLAARRARGWWIWPLWILLGVLPVLPVMATPHTGYMLGVGYAIAMVLGPGSVQRPIKGRAKRWSARVAIGFLIAISICAPIHRALWTAFPAAERLAIQQIGLSPPPETGETHLFLINLPFVNIYLQPTLTSLPRADRPNIECHVLTYSPNALRADQSCRIEQLDSHRFSLSIEGTPFFAGFLGRFLLDGMSRGGRLEPGQVVTGEFFDVEIAEASERGVGRLIFSFHEPLTSENYRFYVASRECSAARLTFGSGASAAPPTAVAPTTAAQVAEIAERIEAGDAAALDDLLAGLTSIDGDVRRAAAAEYVNRVLPVVEALGGPPDASPSATRDWWHTHVRNRALRDIQRGRREFTDLRNRLQTLYTIIDSAARLIRSDLYLTGPPFPGPK
ncbi:MAG: hypothetical protein IID33_06625, partial [Planctomycetes bacterium]|nr:hypothetical protein [Planctomycetota bacterium]